QGHVALGDRLVEGRVVQRDGRSDLVAELLEQLTVDFGVEPSGIPGRLRHDDRNAFAGIVLGEGRGRRDAYKSGSRQGCKDAFETKHDVFVSFSSGSQMDGTDPPCEGRRE